MLPIRYLGRRGATMSNAMEDRLEPAAALDPAGGPFRMNGPDGLAYLKTILEMADKADRFLFDITRTNFIAFGALSVTGTGIFTSMDRGITLVLVCTAAIAISFGSSLLALFYHRYSSSLFAKAWMIEKAWLRGQRSDSLLAKYRPGKPAPGSAPATDEGRNSGGTLALSYERYRRWPLTFYPLANLMPAIGAIAILCLVGYGAIKP